MGLLCCMFSCISCNSCLASFPKLQRPLLQNPFFVGAICVCVCLGIGTWVPYYHTRCHARMQFCSPCLSCKWCLGRSCLLSQVPPSRSQRCWIGYGLCHSKTPYVVHILSWAISGLLLLDLRESSTTIWLLRPDWNFWCWGYPNLPLPWLYMLDPKRLGETFCHCTQCPPPKKKEMIMHLFNSQPNPLR